MWLRGYKSFPKVDIFYVFYSSGHRRWFSWRWPWVKPRFGGQLRDDFENGPTVGVFTTREWEHGSFRTRGSRLCPTPVSRRDGRGKRGMQATRFCSSIRCVNRLAIIDELAVSLWVRAAASGMRPAFRVVFPRTAHPATSQPLTTLLYGTSSTGGGQWSYVEVKRPIELYEAQRRVLKAQHGPAVDLRDAFIDAIVLNVFNGAGIQSFRSMTWR